jgi:FkbM family methyltransferase
MVAQLKRVGRRIARCRPLGIPAAVVSYAVGATGLARKISRECDWTPGVVDVEVPAGGRFRMYSAGGRDQVARVLWYAGWEAWERPLPDLFGALARSSRCVLDVGAYSGFYSLLAATVNPSAEVVAFEPFPEARQWLHQNLTLNGLEARVRIVPAAAGDRDGRAELHVPVSDYGWLETACSLDPAGLPRVAAIPVDLIAIDSWRSASGRISGPVDLIKIDAEGWEGHVLAGARRALAETRPVVFVEVLPVYVPGGRRFRPAPEVEAIRQEANYLDGVLGEGGIEWRSVVEGVPYRNDHVLCPAERKADLEEMARSLGYQVTGVPTEAA